MAVTETWSPSVLGRSRLDERRWAYLAEAPFDMDPWATPLVGTTVTLDGRACEVRGVVPSMPTAPIRAGQPVQLLVFAAP